MSKSQRLASFGGPSTPTKINRVASNPPSPAAQRTALETTYHRKLRVLLLDFRLAAQTWQDLVQVDGVKAAKALIDTRTELDNTLKTYGRPQKPLVGEKLKFMDFKLRELDNILHKMSIQREKIHNAVNNTEILVNEAHRTKGWTWVAKEALWCSWSLDKFYQSLLALLPEFHRSLETQRGIVSVLRSHGVSFEQSKEALQTWSSHTLNAWEDLDELFSVEVDNWPSRKR